jgi:hypothetical protein
MNLSLRCAIALAAFSAIAAGAHAETKNVITTLVEAIEIQVKSTVLPLSSSSALVVTPCSGCAPRSHAQTPATEFFINKTSVTLADFRVAVAEKPDLMLTVAYDVKTGNLVSITADLPNRAVAATQRRR